MQIARLNHKAGRKAVECSSFRAGSVYFQNAIQLLPDDHWSTQNELSLDLYSSAAECAFVNSNLEELQYYSKIILSSKCSILDKIRVYHVLMRSYQKIELDRNELFDHVELGLTALQELGCPLPAKKGGQTVATVWQMATLSSKVKRKWTPEKLANLPVATDPTSLAIMKTLDEMFHVCFVKNQDLVPLVALTLAKVTFEDGLSPWSPLALSFLGLVLSVFMGDAKHGKAYSMYALRMVKEKGYRVTDCRTVSLCYSTTLHWSQTIESCMGPMMKSYSVGMAMGDIDIPLLVLRV